MNRLEHAFRPSAVNRPSLIPVQAENMGVFRQMLAQVDRSDPFSKSAGYYAITGRKGLWVYGDENTSMVIARHPNREESILFFPPLGDDPAGLIVEAIQDPQVPDGEIELARIGSEDQKLVAQLRGTNGTTHTETVLDWTYPVHIIDPELVIASTKAGSGKLFSSFRGHLNNARRQDYRACPIDIDEHEDALRSIIDQWANDMKSETYSYNDLTDPTLAAIELMKQKNNLDIGGTISFDAEDQPIGMWLWEQTENTAMSLVRSYLHGKRGNAEFGILSMVEQLQGAGIPEMCLGGSETGSLDNFKTKMNPIRSVNLTTLSLPRRAHTPEFQSTRLRSLKLENVN